jgi:hypothetical protein
VVRGLQVVTVGGEQGGLEHPVEAGEGGGVGGHDGLVEEPAEGGADVFTGAEAAELAAAFAEEAGVAGGFPDVLAEQIFQLGFADAVDERGGGADEVALGFEEEALEAGHVLHGGHAAGGGREVRPAGWDFEVATMASVRAIK